MAAPADASTSQHRADTGHELPRLEGLRHVVVRADLEPRDAVDDVVARGQQDDGRSTAGGAQLAQDVEPRSAGEHDVEHDEVGLVIEGGREGRVPVARVPDVVSLSDEV